METNIGEGDTMTPSERMLAISKAMNEAGDEHMEKGRDAIGNHDMETATVNIGAGKALMAAAMILVDAARDMAEDEKKGGGK